MFVTYFRTMFETKSRKFEAAYTEPDPPHSHNSKMTPKINSENTGYYSQKNPILGAENLGPFNKTRTKVAKRKGVAK